MGSINGEVATDLFPILRLYKEGTVERLFNSPYVPPSPEQDTITGVLSKDVSISPDVSARLYLPNLTPSVGLSKLPILLYFHAGGFTFESAFSTLHHAYVTAIVSQSKALAVSVEYRLAPEHLLPAAYQDSWTALQWIASHSLPNTTKTEPWLISHADFNRLYLGGDSAGGNIVHNIALRAGVEGLNGDVKIKGGFLCHPYFWGSSENRKERLEYRFWMMANPSAVGGIDNPMINPFVGGAPSLAGLGFSRLLVCAAEKDAVREIAVRYAEAVRVSGWRGEVEVVEVQEEVHCFQIKNPHSDNAKDLIKRLACFIMA